MMQPAFVRLTAAAVALTATAAAQTSSPTQSYKFVELTNLGANNGQVYSINASGQAVGFSNEQDTSHAIRWFNDQTTDLHGLVHFNLTHPYFGEAWHQAYGISDGGQIVGTARLVVDCTPDDITVQNAFIASPSLVSDLATPYPGDAIVNLRTFGGLCSNHDSAAVAISNANHAVGWADGRLDSAGDPAGSTPAGDVHAFLVTPVNGQWYVDADSNLVNDLMIDLGTLDAFSAVSAATDVNDFGVVVGYSYTRTNTLNNFSGYHAFRVVPQGGLWRADGNSDGVNDLIQDLGTLGGLNSWARGINTNGVIVGEAETASLVTHAFKWENGTMTDLGTLGGRNSSAASISDDGVIVGWSENAAGKRRACAWINGQVIDLNGRLLATDSPGMDLTEARDINNRGDVVGWGVSRGGSQTSLPFQLRVATPAEVEAANAIVAGTTVETPSDSGDGSTGGTGGGQATGGVPISGTPNTLGDEVDTATDGGETAGNEADGGDAPAAGLCGAGGLGLMPLTMLGLAMLRRRVR